MGLTAHSHLALRLKKEYSYTYTPPLGLHGLFQGDLYLYYEVISSLQHRFLMLHGGE